MKINQERSKYVRSDRKSPEREKKELKLGIYEFEEIDRYLGTIINRETKNNTKDLRWI